MPTIVVKLPKQEKPEHKPPTLFWYDTEKQKMLSFKADKLEFHRTYDNELKKWRILPTPVTNQTNIKIQDPENIVKKWYRDYINYNFSNSSMEGKDFQGIKFQVPSDELEDFLYDLSRNNLEGLEI